MANTLDSPPFHPSHVVAPILPAEEAVAAQAPEAPAVPSETFEEIVAKLTAEFHAAPNAEQRIAIARTALQHVHDNANLN